MAHAGGVRFVRWVAAVLVGPPLIYLAAAFAFAVAVAPREPPTDGVTIYACDNGMHADLVLPVAAAGMDWRTLFVPKFFAGPVEGYDHIGIGWGSRDFYLHTPTWADVSPRLAVKALLWDETALRVDYRPRPRFGQDCGQWRVGDAEYRAIVAHVQGSLLTTAGRPELFAPGYGRNDAFFKANGRYTVIDTCNQWTGQAMRLAGAPVASWTPFSFLVMWHLPPAD